MVCLKELGDLRSLSDLASGATCEDDARVGVLRLPGAPFGESIIVRYTPCSPYLSYIFIVNYVHRFIGKIERVGCNSRGESIGITKVPRALWNL